MDPNGDGEITQDEFRDFLCSIELGLNKKQMDLLVKVRKRLPAASRSLALAENVRFWRFIKGHKFVEENRPATFIYPIFSLWGDFRMFGEVLMGMHPVFAE